MDTLFCLLMAIYMILASNSEYAGKSTKKFLHALSAIMVLLAVIHIIT